MKKRPGRGKKTEKKGKLSRSQGRHRELSLTNEDQINQREGENKEDREMTKEMKPGELSLNDLVCTDNYSLYERTSLKRQNSKFYEGKSFKTALEKYDAKRNHTNKGQLKSSLPPLRQKRHNDNLLTFVAETHANEHSLLETNPGDHKENKQEMRRESIAPTFSESRKKLALSLSFVGIYDLDDMYVETKENGKGDKRIKDQGSRGFETLDESEGTSHEISPDVARCDKERTKTYVIKTLKLEEESPLSQRTLFQDELILPEITKHNLSGARPSKIVHSENEKRKNNRLPSIGRTENRIPKFAYSGLERRNRHRRKARVHDNSFAHIYLQTKIPQLPILVNGRITCHSGQLDT